MQHYDEISITNNNLGLLDRTTILVKHTENITIKIVYECIPPVRALRFKCGMVTIHSPLVCLEFGIRHVQYNANSALLTYGDAVDDIMMIRITPALRDTLVGNGILPPTPPPVQAAPLDEI